MKVSYQNTEERSIFIGVLAYVMSSNHSLEN